MIKKLFKWSIRLVILAWFVFTMIIGMWLWKENSTPVVVRYFGFEHQDWTLGGVMTAMLIIGFSLGSVPLFVTSLLKELKHNRNIRKVKKELSKAQTRTPSPTTTEG